MAEEQLKEGDVVQLRSRTSGDFFMTIEALMVSSGRPSARCVWYEQTEQRERTIKREIITTAALEKKK